MNLRHAAALALVGWYLMTPPCRSFSHWNFGQSAGGSCFMDPKTPLRERVRVADTKQFYYKIRLPARHFQWLS